MFKIHRWGDKDVDWEGIGAAADFIGQYIAKWGRINVLQTKEKWGTVRVYINWGWSCFHAIIFPFHHYIKPWWPAKIDFWLSGKIIFILYRLSDPYRKFIYNRAYKLAVKKWPHLKQEIIIAADWPEFLT